MGFYTLAAAALGWRVVAFEASKLDLLSLQASIAYNGMTGKIDVHQVGPFKVQSSVSEAHVSPDLQAKSSQIQANKMLEINLRY